MVALNDIAPAFVKMAHEIVWCTAATVDAQGRPRSRVLHPMWQWQGGKLTGWIATGPTPVKRAHLAGEPLPVLQLLGAEPGHLRGRVPGGMGLRRCNAAHGLGSVRQRPGAGGLRSGHHSRLGRCVVADICRAEARPLAAAGNAGQRVVAGNLRGACLAGIGRQPLHGEGATAPREGRHRSRQERVAHPLPLAAKGLAALATAMIGRPTLGRLHPVYHWAACSTEDIFAPYS